MRLALIDSTTAADPNGLLSNGLDEFLSGPPALAVVSAIQRCSPLVQLDDYSRIASKPEITLLSMRGLLHLPQKPTGSSQTFLQ